MPTRQFEFIERLYRMSVEYADPQMATVGALQSLDDLHTADGRIVVVAVGKAAEAMFLGARSCLRQAIDRGVIVTKHAQKRDALGGYTLVEAGHPIPNDASLQAGEAGLAAVSDLTPVDTVIALISGGGSALLEAPRDGITLADMQVTTELLMHAGADIYDLNTVRKALSQIKGGGLRRAMGDARCITLLLSDVLGNDLSMIASGPTILEPDDPGKAWQILMDFGLQDRVPVSVQRELQTDAISVAEIDTSRDITRVIADNDTMVEAVASAAASAGFDTRISWRDWRGDARELGRIMAEGCLAADADILIGGGEATCKVLGNGRGGRNCEAALVAALALHGNDEWTIASLASDGDDGNSGAAGAIVDGNTVDDESAARAALAESNSAGYLAKRDALLIPGLTGTNVNDIYIAVRKSAFQGVRA